MKTNTITSLFICLIMILAAVPVNAFDLVDPYLVGSNLELYSTSAQPSLSGDGQYVAFKSKAPNLVPGDTGNTEDVFRKDVTTGSMVRVAEGSAGVMSTLSSDGSRLLISTGVSLVDEDINGQIDVYLKDIPNDTATLISLGVNGQHCNRSCYPVAMTPDANIVIYTSESNNLIDGENTYKTRYFKRNVTTGITELLNLPAQGYASPTDISADGRYVVYFDAHQTPLPGYPDTIVRWDDIRVFDIQTSTSVYANVASSGERANHPNTGDPSISDDGRYVSFFSYADNLSPSDNNSTSDIFTHDMITGQTERISVRSDGSESNSRSFAAEISADGRYVVFSSGSSLAPVGNTGGFAISYVHDRVTHITRRATPLSMPGESTQAAASENNISADNKYVVFRNNDALYVRSTEAIFADNTPPEIQPVFTPSPNYEGWNNTPVQLKWSITELDSLLTDKTGCDPVNINSETTDTGVTFTCSVTSSGGTSVKSATVKYDGTLPTISYSYNIQPNSYGWNNSDVTVSFNCDDQLSSILVCNDPITFLHEGAGQFALGTAMDKAENFSTISAPINIDKTLPSGTFVGSTTVLKFLGQTVSGSAGDELSGVEKIEIISGSTTISSQNGEIALSCDAAKTNCNWSASPSVLTSGAPNLTLKVTDLAGNIYITTKQYIII